MAGKSCFYCFSKLYIYIYIKYIIFFYHNNQLQFDLCSFECRIKNMIFERFGNRFNSSNIKHSLIQ